ncbi:BREX-1 system adenine-specific DNA-methyltransferase PglX [Opitutales bacterium]|nr:BREX-1 system adenine-specific DNA-methyltransferase PglX [Opitutales bacterium]
MSQLTAIRLLYADEPAGPLLEAVRDLAEGRSNKATYQVEPASFRQVPNAPFAYWVSEHIRSIFAEIAPFECGNRTTKQGLATADDFRFVRAIWETSKDHSNKRWSLFVKGGSFSPFYADIILQLNWGQDGKELKSWAGTLYNNSHWSRIIKNPDFYFRPGITWPRRTRRFCPKLMPPGAIFSDGGQVAYNPGKELVTAAVLFSAISQTFISLSLGTTSQDEGGTNPQFMAGMVGKVPFKLTDKIEMTVKPLAKSAWSTKRSTDTANQTSHAFYAPALSPGQFGSRNKKATTA